MVYRDNYQHNGPRFLGIGYLNSFLRPHIDIGNFFIVYIANNAECLFDLLDSKNQGS